MSRRFASCPRRHRRAACHRAELAKGQACIPTAAGRWRSQPAGTLHRAARYRSTQTVAAARSLALTFVFQPEGFIDAIRQSPRAVDRPGGFRSDREPGEPSGGSGVRTTFGALSHSFLAEYYADNPTYAGDLGLHEFDSRIEDVSQTAILAEAAPYQALAAAVHGRRSRHARPHRTPRPRVSVARSRVAADRYRGRPRLGPRSGSLLERAHELGVRTDQARLRTGRRAPAQPDRTREGDARDARARAAQSRQSAAHLHTDRDRADRRQHRLLQDGGRRSLRRAWTTPHSRASSSARTMPSSPRSATTRTGCRRTCCRNRTAPLRTGQTSIGASSPRRK